MRACRVGEGTQLLLSEKNGGEKNMPRGEDATAAPSVTTCNCIQDYLLLQLSLMRKKDC
jgi:hypothetical protein